MSPADPRDLRIDQVVLEFSLRGGIESVAFELQRAFRAAGLDSRVLAAVTDAPAPDVRRIGSPLARIPSRGRARHLGRAVSVPAFTLAASAVLALRPRAGRVVLSHGDTLVGDVCVVHAVNRANLEAKRAQGAWRWRLNPMHAWVSLRDRIMIGGLRFRRYVALSQRVVEELQRFYGVPRDRIAVIPNGVNLERFAPGPDDRDATRDALGVPRDAPMLLFVGHEFDRKGLAHAIDALAQPGLEAASLVVAGAGAAGPYAERAARLGVGRRVRFLGPRSDLPALYRAGDAFVFPTAYESFSLTCMEAMACGLPVFATPTGGIEDYLRDGVNGRAIEADGAAIARALRAAFADPALHARLRQGAVETARDYAWPRIAERYRALLDEVRREIEAERHPRPAMGAGMQAAGREG
jgi:glycosyltransferase involved in cell wall biosynthesis